MLSCSIINAHFNCIISIVKIKFALISNLTGYEYNIMDSNHSVCFFKEEFKGHFGSSKPIIGIIGGAGPEAGVTMQSSINNSFKIKQGAWRDYHFPIIQHVSFPFSEMLEPPLDEIKVKNQLSKAIGYMEQHTDYYVIACNTLHLYLPDKKPQNLISLFDLVNESLASYSWAKETPLIFASATSVNNNLFGRLLGRTDVEYYDSEISQGMIDAILKGNNVDLYFIENIAYNRPVILGCTEYSQALANSKSPLIDPIRLAADKMVALSQEEKYNSKTYCSI